MDTNELFNFANFKKTDDIEEVVKYTKEWHSEYHRLWKGHSYEEREVDLFHMSVRHYIFPLVKILKEHKAKNGNEQEGHYLGKLIVGSRWGKDEECVLLFQDRDGCLWKNKMNEIILTSQNIDGLIFHNYEYDDKTQFLEFILRLDPTITLKHYNDFDIEDRKRRAALSQERGKRRKAKNFTKNVQSSIATDLWRRLHDEAHQVAHQHLAKRLGISISTTWYSPAVGIAYLEDEVEDEVDDEVDEVEDNEEVEWDNGYYSNYFLGIKSKENFTPEEKQLGYIIRLHNNETDMDDFDITGKKLYDEIYRLFDGDAIMKEFLNSADANERRFALAFQDTPVLGLIDKDDLVRTAACLQMESKKDAN